MKGMQLPLVSNTATTGHKLQGSKVVNIFVLDWNYTTNWPYVVLSRVTTMRELFFRKKLQRAHTHSKVQRTNGNYETKISTDIHHVWRKLKNLVGQMVMTTRDRVQRVL